MRAELQKLGLRVYGGENAPYLWVKTPNDTPSWKFFEEMLYGASVVCTPGVGFGPSGEGYIRLTAFGEHEDCKEAMELSLIHILLTIQSMSIQVVAAAAVADVYKRQEFRQNQVYTLL